VPNNDLRTIDTRQVDSTLWRLVEQLGYRASLQAVSKKQWGSAIYGRPRHDLVDQAPWVPLGTRYWVNLVSQRLGNYQSNPQWGPLVDQMWVR